MGTEGWRRKMLLAGLLLALAAPGAWAQAPTPSAEARPQVERLRYFTEDYPPSNYLDNGRLTGYAVDLLRLMWKRLGVAAQPIEVSNWARAYRQAETVPNTLLFTMNRTPERENRFLWVGPIFTHRYVLFGRSGRDYGISKMTDANRYRIGVMREDVGHELLREQGVSEAQLDKVADFRQLLKMLDAGRIDLICISDSLLSRLDDYHIVSRARLQNVRVVREMALYYALSRGTDKVAVEQLQGALRALEPERRQLLKNYGLDS